MITVNHSDLVFLYLDSNEPLPPLINGRFLLLNHQILGSGSFSTVKLAIDVSSCKRYACKIINVKNLSLAHGQSNFTLDGIKKEIAVLRNINHPNIVSIRDVYYDKTSQSVHILMNRVSGGDLFEFITRSGGVKEPEAKFIFYQLLLSIGYLHQHNICHRDIKAENILLESPYAFSKLIVADFGMAKELSNMCETMQTRCGTFTYMAPEIINSSRYSKEVDCWALGTLLYAMISASMPFGDDDTTNLFLNINHGSFSFEMEVWAKISIECKDIICKLLTVNPAHRISIAEALKHPWMANQEDLLQKLYQKATYISHSV